MSDGYAVAHIDDLGEGYGFRKVRRELGVNAFGVNAIVMPPGYEGGPHFHDEQEELYIILRGRMRITFGLGEGEEWHVLGPGGLARVDAGTIRRLANVSEDEDAIYICVGGKDGYVGRDGRVPDGYELRPGMPPGASTPTSEG